MNPQELRKGTRVEVTGTAEALLAKIAELDGVEAEMKRRARRLKSISLLIAIAGCLVVVFSDIPYHGFITFSVFAAAVGIVIYSFAGPDLASFRWRRDHLRELLKVVTRDAPAGAKMHLQLSAVDCKTKLTESPYTARKKGKQETFRDDWLTLQGRFCDDTDFQLSLSELSRKRSWTNPRGKPKSKTKSVQLAQLRLGYPAERYGDIRHLRADLNRAVKLPATTTLKGLKSTERALFLKVVVPKTSLLRPTVTLMFLSMYQVLNLSHSSPRALGRGGAA